MNKLISLILFVAVVMFATMGSAQAANCTDFCIRMENNCTGPNEQFYEMDHCKKNCELWDATDLTNQAGNTFGCRNYHLGLVEGGQSAATHCPHAGPFGKGQCGTYCEGYCNGAKDLFDTPARCVEKCNADVERWNVTIKYSTDYDIEDNTLNCRLDQCLKSNKTKDQCGMWSSKCRSPAYNYCKNVNCPLFFNSTCNNITGQFPTGQDECVEACQYWYFNETAEDNDITSGTSVNCREYHVDVAMGPGTVESLETHCPHGGRFGTADAVTHCGDECSNLCNVMSQNCPHVWNANQTMINGACYDECKKINFNPSVYLGDSNGTNTVECRMMYAEKAAFNSDMCMYALANSSMCGVVNSASSVVPGFATLLAAFAALFAMYN